MKGIVETALIVAVLTLSLRRGAFLVAALLRPRPLLATDLLPTVALLVPARNEMAVVDGLLEALGALTYPADRLSVVLVSDGCADATPDTFRAWARQRANVRVVERPRTAGKAAALNAGLRLAKADVIVVMDADLAPRPDILQALVPPFADARVGAVAAFLRPANADTNIVSRYAAVTTWVHQLVTSAALDRLGLNPPTLGAAAYRRSALEHVGGFPAVPVGVDVATSAAIIRAGWRTRFVVDAVVDNTVVEDVRGYMRQHIRWSRGALRGLRDRSPRQKVSSAQRLETTIAAIGYGDRIVFAIAAAGALTLVLPAWPPLLYLAAPGMEILAALRKAGVEAPADRARFVLATVLFFAVDVASSLVALLLHLARRPVRWHSPRAMPVERTTQG